MKIFLLKILFCAFAISMPISIIQAQTFFEKHLFNHPIHKSGYILNLKTGQYAVAYSSSDQTEKYIIITLFDDCGNLSWTKKILPQSNSSDILGFHYSGNKLWLGAVLGNRYPDSALAVVSFDLTGNLQNQFVLKSTGEYVWYKFHVTNQGDIIFTGNGLDIAEPSNAVLRVNPSGQILRHHQYLNNHIWGMSTVTPDGGVLNISGYYIYKLDPQGTIQWIKEFPGYSQSLVPPIAGPDGYYIFSNPYGNKSNAQVIKLNLQGNLVWESSAFPTLEIDAACLDQSGQIYLTVGYYDSGQSGVGILKLNDLGDMTHAWKLPIVQGSMANYDIGVSTNNDLLLLSGVNGPGGNGVILQKIPANNTPAYACNGQSFLPTEIANPITTATAVAGPTGVFSNFGSTASSFLPRSVSFREESFCGKITPQKITLGKDTTLCPGTKITLTPDTLPAGSYIWNTGDNTHSITVDKPGMYWLNVSDACNTFDLNDSIQIKYYPEEKLSVIHEPPHPKLGDRIEFSNTNNQSITWVLPNGDTTTGAKASYLADQPGSFLVKFYTNSENGCTTGDSILLHINAPKLYMPDAFTPDEDGLNDLFEVPKGALFWYQMEIYDRFGKRLSNSVNEGWDGTIKGTKASVGVYVYMITYQIYEGQAEQVLYGKVTLLR